MYYWWVCYLFSLNVITILFWLILTKSLYRTVTARDIFQTGVTKHLTITVLVSGWWKWFFRVNNGAVSYTHLVTKNFCHSQVANIKTVRPSVAILCSIWRSPLPRLPESAAPWPCQNIGGLTQFLFPLLGHDGPKLGLPRWSPWWKFGSCLTPDGCENCLTCWQASSALHKQKEILCSTWTLLTWRFH